MDTYAKLIRFFHGPFIDAILRGLKIDDTEENREEVKWIIKESMSIDSMANLTSEEIGEVVFEVAFAIAEDFGVMLPYPGEPDNIDEITMAAFLALKK